MNTTRDIGRLARDIYIYMKCYPKFSGLLLPSGQKLILRLLATITLKVVAFHTYTSVPAILPFLKCILEAMFCEGVQHCLHFCLDHLNCVRLAAFQLHLQSKEQRKISGSQVRRVGLVEDDSDVVFGLKKSMVKREVWDGAHFHAATTKRHSSRWN